MSFGFAYAIPDFKDIIPFIGVTSGMMLALVFPPLLELVVFTGVWRRGNVIKMVFNVILDMIYIVLGVLFVIVGIYSNYKIMSNRNRSQ
ncbi:hypothetical protein OESDEN_24638 [Oesophagostomum dentatum]|uniref:Amino acid transporter transmembrane domain-containing protein n=1 Tax=Oesophagostomum dentatum TaxID=61180 RepID=A0A0B1RVS6_OESDE|nr:hypothetical protein OESDEN_24638 [Oesophagostomum dentatum]